MGYIRNSLNKGPPEMYAVGGCPELYFFRNWLSPLTIWGFCLFWSGFKYSCPPPPPTLHHHVRFWGRLRHRLPYFWGGQFGKEVSENVGIVGDLYEGKNYEKMGMTWYGSHHQFCP